MMETYYKVLNDDLSCPHGGSGRWSMEWMPRIEDDLQPCRNGYHVLTREQLILWLGPAIWTVEIDRKDMIMGTDKCVVRSARLLERLETWNDQTARLFAADCAERVLPIFEKEYPSEPAPRNAIRAARAFACGDATESELRTARDAALAVALDAARVAAPDAVWDAALDAALAAVWAAALDDVWAAARGAARAAALAAAWASDEGWRTAKLFEYLDGVLPVGVKES